MKVLKVNKTQLYNLIKDKTNIKLPKMKDTTFFKDKNYFQLIFGDYRCSLFSCGYMPRLVVSTYDFDKGEYLHLPTITLSIDELAERGMLTDK